MQCCFGEVCPLQFDIGAMQCVLERSDARDDAAATFGEEKKTVLGEYQPLVAKHRMRTERVGQPVAVDVERECIGPFRRVRSLEPLEQHNCFDSHVGSYSAGEPASAPVVRLHHLRR